MRWELHASHTPSLSMPSALANLTYHACVGRNKAEWLAIPLPSLFVLPVKKQTAFWALYRPWDICQTLASLWSLSTSPTTPIFSRRLKWRGKTNAWPKNSEQARYHPRQFLVLCLKLELAFSSPHLIQESQRQEISTTCCLLSWTHVGCRHYWKQASFSTFKALLGMPGQSITFGSRIAWGHW